MNIDWRNVLILIFSKKSLYEHDEGTCTDSILLLQTFVV